MNQPLDQVKEWLANDKIVEELKRVFITDDHEERKNATVQFSLVELAEFALRYLYNKIISPFRESGFFSLFEAIGRALIDSVRQQEANTRVCLVIVHYLSMSSTE